MMGITEQLEGSLKELEGKLANELPWNLVTHQRPDTDALACLWLAWRFIVPAGAEWTVTFIAAGERIEDEDRLGHNVLEMDVGGGDCDQHGRCLTRSSSFELTMKRYGLEKDPALATILELTRATDNVERIPLHSVHYYFKGLPQVFRDRNSQEIDWSGVCERAFEVLDVLYGQEQARIKSHEEFTESGRTKTLQNGLRVATVWWKPHLRDAAYESGAHVAMWTVNKGKKEQNRFEVGIQVSRNADLVTLEGVMRAIRLAEAAKRGIEVSENLAGAIGGNDQNPVPGWFLHDSRKLIVCGSRARHLQGDEFTKLTPHEILEILHQELGKLKGREQPQRPDRRDHHKSRQQGRQGNRR